MNGTIVVERSIVDALGTVPAGLRVLPRSACRWRCAAGGWAPLDPEAVLEHMASIPGAAVVLARTARADAGAACVARIAGLFGHDVLRLPDDRDEASWAAAVAGEMCGAIGLEAERALQVICCGPAVAPQLPRRDWGRSGLSVPALRPATLARWASTAWRACAWCAGGAVRGAACRRCGTPIQTSIGGPA